jgi:diguanylate cyclase (GGDEF)-like protein/PAS domain S-box-containing protein
VGIPGEVTAEQFATARRILARQSGPAREALAAGKPGLAESSLLRESANPDLLTLILVDPAGNVAAATRGDWRGRPAGSLVPGLGLLGDSSQVPQGDVRIGVDRPHRTLTAALPVADSTVAAGPLRDAAPAGIPGGAGPWLLALELDQVRAHSAAWGRRLSPQAAITWLALASLVGLLAALLVQHSLGRPLGRLTTQARLIAEGDLSADAGLLGRGELATLAAGLGLAGERIRAAEAELQNTETRWVRALDGAGDGVWDWDMTSDRVYFSPSWKTMLGHEPDEIGDQLDEWLSRVHPEDREPHRAAIARHASGETPAYGCEYRLRTKSGGWRWVLDRGRITERDSKGRGLRMVGTHADITDRKLAERSLTYLVALETVLLESSRTLLTSKREAVEAVVERVLGAVARGMDVERASVFVLDPEDEVLRASQTWQLPSTGNSSIERIPLPVRRLPRWMETLNHGEDIRIADIHALPGSWAEDHSLLTEIGARAVAAVPLRMGERMDGFVSVEMLGEPRDWRESELRALRFLGDLIGAAFERRKFELELVESRQRLEEIALYDALTGLPNRRLLAERMSEAMATAVETGTQLAVCYLDLDGFKPINDLHGHSVGDHILMSAAGRLREQVREGDTVARLGGDEFVLLAGGFESLSECSSAMERVIKLLAQPYTIHGEELRVTASGGVTLYPRDPHDADTLLRHADYAMYQAKQRGRNRCRFFDALRDRRAHVRRSQLERIGEAIDDGELRLYFQPKVDMHQGQVIGAEGLVRWQHPEKGILPPAAFIPMLEGSDLQQRLDWWVLEAGMQQLESWHAQGLEMEVSLNVSARSVQSEGFVERLGERLHGHRGLPRGALSLEILESDAMGDLDAVAGVMERCLDLGVTFALDDFGTGYSTLTYFRRLPAEVLKIDQTFVRDMLRSSDDRNIVEGVVGLAHAFRRKVIAEGVESAAHGLMLLRLGCFHAQGYGIAEPMPAERLPAWVERYVGPPLWGLSPEFDWSGPILDILTLESVHRDWVARVLRAPSEGSSLRPPDLDTRRCGFGRWHSGDGRRLFGHLTTFRDLEPLHNEVHAKGRALMEARERGLPIDAGKESLIEARDHLIIGLHRFQEQVLTQAG